MTLEELVEFINETVEKTGFSNLYFYLITKLRFISEDYSYSQETDSYKFTQHNEPDIIVRQNLTKSNREEIILDITIGHKEYTIHVSKKAKPRIIEK